MREESVHVFELVPQIHIVQPTNAIPDAPEAIEAGSELGVLFPERHPLVCHSTHLLGRTLTSSLA